MAPAKIMIIRHAEKPKNTDDRGIRASGKDDPHALTARGWQRAGALARFFHPPNETFAHPALARPDHIFGARFDKKSKAPTRRPVQTVKPLALLLGAPIDKRFTKGDERKLVEAVMETSGVVLVAWAHEDIFAIVKALPNAPPIPKTWPDDRFDIVWIFDQKPGGGWTFSQAPQSLLAGDRPQTIA